MKASVIKEMTSEEINDQLVEEAAKYTKLKMNHAVSPLESPIDIKKQRKFVARLKTELRTREIST